MEEEAKNEWTGKQMKKMPFEDKLKLIEGAWKTLANPSIKPFLGCLSGGREGSLFPLHSL